jgi:hypothetical protein
MGRCKSCRSNLALPRDPARLLQIRHRYQARWRALKLSVTMDTDDWILVVQDWDTRNTLYTGHRAGPRAARIAAAEFAIFSVLGPGSPVIPERLAEELNWQQVW